MKSAKLFYWQGINQQQLAVKGYFLSDNKDQVLERLLQQQIQPIKLSRGKQLRKRVWKNTTRIQFIEQLGMLLKSGIPLMHCVTLLAQQATETHWRAVLNELIYGISQGETMNCIMQKYPDAFPPLYWQLVAIGEHTGNLEPCCLQLAEQQNQQQQLLQKITTALRYPCFIGIMALLMCLFMLLFVLPEFSAIYQSMSATLPKITRKLMLLSTLLQQYGLSVLAFLSFIILLVKYLTLPSFKWLNARLTLVQQHILTLLLQLPSYRALYRHKHLCEIFMLLALTLKSGLPMIQGLSLTRDAIRSTRYKIALELIIFRIEQGDYFHQAIEDDPLFTELSKQLIKLGEETATLEALLAKLALHYQQETKQQLTGWISWIEPLMMLLVGALVGFLLIALYLPLFSLGDMWQNA